MIAKQGFLAFVGFCAGGVIAAGIFAFIATIGVVVRLVGKTRTASHIRTVEDSIVLGGAFGNLACLYGPRLPGGVIAAGLFGGFAGIFTGCLIMSLAETLNALPVLSRRLRLKTGLPYVILGIAAGKCAGAVFYFFR